MNIALIPARAGSKRFPGKNLALLGGKPLVVWTIDAVLQSELFEKVVFSSDDPKALEIAGQYDRIELHKRPQELASDTATAHEVLRHVVRRQIAAGYSFCICGLFLPTCPFRTSDDIRRAWQLLDEDTDAVVSVQQYKIPPQFALLVDEKSRALPAWGDSPLLSGRTRTDQQKPLHHPNGGIYMGWSKVCLEKKSFFNGKIRVYVMPWWRSIDIDTELELKFAEFLLRMD